MLWKSMLAVGLGGFVGACMRYSIGLVEVRWNFPMMTFMINILGAVLIGIIAEVASQMSLGSHAGVLFFKTGLCGGFTTFSTFSLETVTLMEQEQYITAGTYAVSSVLCCVVGVMVGKMLARAVLTTTGLATA